MEVTLPEESPESLAGVTRLDVPGEASDLSLVVTALLVETVLPLSPETVAADPRESLNSAERDWVGISLFRPELPAFVETASRLPAGTAAPLSPLDVPVWAALRAASEFREVLEISSGRPALKLLLTVSGTLLTIVVSTRLLEKSVALTTVMPLLLLLFIMTVVLLMMVFGLVPYPQGLGLQPT